MEVAAMKWVKGSFFFFFLSGLVAMAQSVPDVFAVLQGNPAIPQALIQRLRLFFEAAFEEGMIIPAQALELLGAVGWQELSPENDVGFAAHALELALVALSSGGVPYEEVLTTLKAAFQEGAMGPLAASKVSSNLSALTQALVRARTENMERIMAHVAERVQNGVPLAALSRVFFRLWATQAPADEILKAVEHVPAGGPPARISPEKPDEEEKPGKGRGRNR